MTYKECIEAYNMLQQPDIIYGMWCLHVQFMSCVWFLECVWPNAMATIAEYSMDMATVGEYFQIQIWKLLKLSTTKAMLAVFHLSNKETKTWT